MICAVVLRRVDTRKCPKRKLLFLIRHGESEWNRAERKGVMSVMHVMRAVRIDCIRACCVTDCVNPPRLWYPGTHLGGHKSCSY